MFETISNLVFSGAAFSTKTSLQLFPSVDHRLCLIYGKNGTGKSTISKAFLKLSDANLQEITSAHMEDCSGRIVPYFSDDQLHKIFVFNEDYIQNKVRLKEDGLGTIVMFGKQAELESLIDAAQKAYDAALSEHEKAATIAKPFNDPTSPLAPSYYLSRMNLALSGDHNWAGRERVITGGRRNASVSNTTYESIVRVKPAKTREEIENEYQTQFDLLCAARNGDAKIIVSASANIAVPDNEATARSLLAQRIEKPELSEREYYLISLLSEGKNQQIERMQTTFENPDTIVCPFCLQPVSTEYKESLVQSIKKILSKIVEEHKASLLAQKISPVVIDDPISSFDHENRIGIMSLLRSDLEKIIVGNANSKIVMMTHDLQSAFDLQKSFDEIKKVADKQGFGKCNSGIFELRERMLHDFRYRKRHEYSELLAEVYRFGMNATLETETTIGNVMRRTLEAFSTFVYKKGMDDISISSEILAALGNEQYSEYFSHLMYRLVLNGESHSEERVRTLMDDNDFLEMLSITEKQRTAKDIICFIYLLNPNHVRAHLSSSGITDSDGVIEAWCKDILSFTGGSTSSAV